MSRVNPNNRQRRIIQLSHELGVVLPPTPARLERPQQLPTFKTHTDDLAAEDLLQRHALEVSQGRPKSGLTRAFSTNNLKKGKHWEPKHILEVLTNWVSQSGSPAVAEALIAKLAAAGLDIGSNQAQRTGLLSRRKSTEGFVDRTRLLKLAVQNDQLDMVRLLAPYADPVALDVCLPIAVRQGNTPVVEILLTYGASVAQTADGQDAFRQACGVVMLSDMVKLMLQSDGRPSSILASQAMTDAVKVGALDTVLYLSRSVADGDYNQAEALQAAVGMGRGDLAIAIIMGNKPPRTEGLSQAFVVLTSSPSVTPASKLQIAEMLLCAGAAGDILSQALQMACDSHFYEMASLLAAYGVSIEYEGASVLKTAIERGQLDLVTSLLNDSSTLNPSLASACVSAIPQQTSNNDRYLLLNLLLRKGAKGTPLDEMLITAADAGDVSSVELLLKPYFPDTPSNGVSPQQNGRKSQFYEKHEIASTDYQDGQALRTAVLRVDLKMTERILNGQPSHQTLTKVFPLTRYLTAADRYNMIELFLRGALTGPPLHAALQDAVAEDVATRDGDLIKLLLEHDADVNYDKGSGLHSVIMQADIHLLELLISRASPQTAATCLPSVMKVSDHRTRHDMMVLMLRAGAAIGVSEVSSCLLETLREKPVDMSLLRLLLQPGNANVNSPQFSIVSQAISNPDPKVLELVLGLGKPSVDTVTHCLHEITSLPSTEGKTWKLKTALGRSKRNEDFGGLLATEVQSLIHNHSRQPSLSTLKLLLDSGADPNDHQAAAFCYAISAASTSISDILLECQRPPTESSLDAALPHALKISDPMDRLTFTKKLITAGASHLEINRGLVHSIHNYTDDISLLSVLASAADASDGEALALATSKESPEIVHLLLAKSKHTEASKNSALERAMSVRDRAIRREMCQRLLKNGISTNVASDALLIAARDGDLELGDILMVHGASITSNNGQAIIEACRGGSAEVVEVLLRTEGHPHKQTLEKGFQAATEVRDLNKRAVIFEKLLKRGVTGEPVDAQLAFAARSGEPGHEVLRVLLAAGADPNYNGGEAVVAATRTAFMGNLELLLGLWDEGGRQKRPSQPTLVRALQASWNLSRETRFQVLKDVFKAGLSVTEDVHVALNDAVNEEDPEHRLVKLLLDNGASPVTNSSKSLVDAARNGSTSILQLLLDRSLPQESIDEAFSQCFTADNVEAWFCESGKETIQILLDKGAQGGALSGMLLQVMRYHTKETSELANELFDLLVARGPDVNFNDGELLQEAASQANTRWTSKLLACHPNTESLSYAFQHIFDTPLDQDDALQLFKMFSEYRDGETRIDVMAQKPGTEPVLVRAMSQYPRSTKILNTLLDAGFYHDQATLYQIHSDIEEEEEMTILTWAIAQPQKKISSSLIDLLLERGAKVNVETRLSRTTPLMLAVQNRRPNIVKTLIIEGADADVTDYKGRSPLSLATDIGGDIAIEMMGNLLAAEPSRDDGSLHNAARELNLPAVKVLVQAGHDPDFPSPNHEGRSALGEACLKASDQTNLTAEREKALQKVISHLVDQGSDLGIKSRGKSLLHICFEAREPIPTSRVFLKAAMWKYINKPINYYNDDNYTYSPTMYVKKILPESDHKNDLLKLLYSYRAVDVFYANEGPQPDDAIGLPEDIKVQERARKARLSRMAEESEDFAISLARKRELANVESQIWAQKSEMEDARRRKLQNEDAMAVRSKAQLEDSLDKAAHQRRMAEQRSMSEAAMSQRKQIAAAEVETEDLRQRKMLEWQNKSNREKVENARLLSSIQVSEREELDRLERNAEERMGRRLDAQRKVIDSQERLARRIAAGPGGSDQQRRQIGYVSEELG